MKYISWSVGILCAAIGFHYYTNRSFLNPVYVNESVVELITDTMLEQTEHHFTASLHAPEDIVLHPNTKLAYMSCGDGQIVEWNPTTMEIQPFVYTGVNSSSCGSLSAEPICGRPLGMLMVSTEWFAAFLPQKWIGKEKYVILVADAYKGLLLVLPDKTIVTLLTHVNDQRLHFANALAMAADGTIYLSDSSSRFQRNQVLYEVLEAQSTGRVIAFYPQQNRSEVIIDQLPFPNGLALVNNDQELLIALTTRYKIVKYHFAEQRLEDFVVLPGIPDNIMLHDNTLWVGMATKRSALTNFLNHWPLIRKWIALLPYSVILRFFKPYGILGAVRSHTGEIQKIFQDPSGRTAYIAGAHIVQDTMYLGSWKNKYLASINLSKLLLG